MNYPGHYHDHHFIYKSLQPAPHEFKKHILGQYKHQFETEGRKAANLHLLNIKTKLKSSSFSLASSDYEIRSKADKCAKACAKVIARADVYAGIGYAESMDVQPPKIDPLENKVGLIGRLSCESWWRRALRKKHGRTIESIALDINIVNKHKDIYTSDASLNRRRTQKTRNRQILEECLAVNELGDEFTLQELSDLSVSNPVIRRGELMTRIAGFEEYAKDKNMVGEFYTFTCPSRFHSAHSKSGKRNKKYTGSTPREAQQYLSKVWQRIRAKLQRENIRIFGFRVCEPQQDGTPHWHLLLFVSRDNVSRCRLICKEYNLQDTPNEAGAQKHRFDAKAIDWKKGTAAGYIAKYIAKNIDGFGLDADLFGNDPIKAAARVDAWASTWGIRQFQQIGGPSVTIWRELRRLSSDDFMNAPEHLQGLHSAADTGNWRRYCELMESHGPSLAKEGAINEKTGEIRFNQYLEPSSKKITGIIFNGVEYVTRRYTWEIKSQCQMKQSATTAELQLTTSQPETVVTLVNVAPCNRQENKNSGVFSPPWSSVNNCTGENINASDNTEKNRRIKGKSQKNPGMCPDLCAKSATSEHDKRFN